jgi:vitamin-K-epoxide reductase (warfarin-sensitive)
VHVAVTDSTRVQSSGRVLFAIIAVLSMAGVIVSAVSLQRHYAKSDTAFCDFNKRFSCDVVNRSEQSSIVGIPVAGIGVAGYAALFVLSTFGRSRADTPNRLLVAAMTGLAFALYLTYVEAYELETWCILCLSSLALIFLVSVSAIVLRLRAARA